MINPGMRWKPARPACGEFPPGAATRTPVPGQQRPRRRIPRTRLVGRGRNQSRTSQRCRRAGAFPEAIAILHQVSIFRSASPDGQKLSSSKVAMQAGRAPPRRNCRYRGCRGTVDRRFQRVRAPIGTPRRRHVRPQPDRAPVARDHPPYAPACAFCWPNRHYMDGWPASPASTAAGDGLRRDRRSRHCMRNPTTTTSTTCPGWRIRLASGCQLDRSAEAGPAAAGRNRGPRDLHLRLPLPQP